MLWNNLHLRTRILFGYGLIIILGAALVLFLLLRTSSLNAQIRKLSVEVTSEAATGTHLAAQVAATQQLIDRYLQQSVPDNLQAANTSLQTLATAVDDARPGLIDPEQRQRRDNLSGELLAYQDSFQRLSILLENQRIAQTNLNIDLSLATSALNNAISAYLRSDTPDPFVLSAFVRAQQQLQVANLLSARLITEQTEKLSENAVDELNQADFNLKFKNGLSDPTIQTAIDYVLENTQRTRTTITQYATNLAQIRQQRDTLLNVQGGQLKSHADAIADAALDRLTSATNELERQGEQTQQLTILALIPALLVAAAFSWLLPRTMTKPLLQLVHATNRLNQGDYGVVVTTRDGSEIGQLALSFNQMSTALSHEREQVLRQQEALTKQNQELEHTLTELQAATAAREQLAVTVRTLSVPVLPILEQVLLIPLVGEIDAKRAQILLERLLDGITIGRARIAIIDITGVPLVDESLVDWLMQATSAGRLMGARCILVGIGPEVAQALVASGADLANLTTRSDLRSAVELAIRGNGFISAKS
jgi:anti-anti-sigma regulatory factor/methyl-accepting chemotaxis protein